MQTLCTHTNIFIFIVDIILYDIYNIIISLLVLENKIGSQIKLSVNLETSI